MCASQIFLEREYFCPRSGHSRRTSDKSEMRTSNILSRSKYNHKRFVIWYHLTDHLFEPGTALRVDLRLNSIHKRLHFVKRARRGHIPGDLRMRRWHMVFGLVAQRIEELFAGLQPRELNLDILVLNIAAQLDHLPGQIRYF